MENDAWRLYIRLVRMVPYRLKRKVIKYRMVKSTAAVVRLWRSSGLTPCRWIPKLRRNMHLRLQDRSEYTERAAKFHRQLAGKFVTYFHRSLKKGRFSLF
jgi:hypothetical protein